MDFHWTFNSRSIQEWSGSSGEEADPITGWTDSKLAPREEAPDWSAIHGAAALALRSDHSAAAALIVLIFPMSAGRKYPPEDAWREESVFFFFDGAIPARSLDIREGDRAHIELVSEVAASGKSAIDVGFSNSNAMPEKLAPSHLPNYHL